MKKASVSTTDTLTKNKQTRAYIKKSGVSTRDMILEKAAELINVTGVVDFRIEALATSLNLSPGNITYHFPKKEDIVSAIWDQYIANMEVMVNQLLTPLLDIKQMFLYFRNTALRTLDRLGVILYYYGDIGILISENDNYRILIAEARKILFKAYDILRENGYLKEIESDNMRELLFQVQFLDLRWWYNHAVDNTNDINEIPSLIDKYILQSMYPMITYMTEKGRDQFNAIIAVV